MTLYMYSVQCTCTCTLYTVHIQCTMYISILHVYQLAHNIIIVKFVIYAKHCTLYMYMYFVCPKFQYCACKNYDLLYLQGGNAGLSVL